MNKKICGECEFLWSNKCPLQIAYKSKKRNFADEACDNYSSHKPSETENVQYFNAFKWIRHPPGSF